MIEILEEEQKSLDEIEEMVNKYDDDEPIDNTVINAKGIPKQVFTSKYCPITQISCMQRDCAWYINKEYGAECAILSIGRILDKGLEIRQ